MSALSALAMQDSAGAVSLTGRLDAILAMTAADMEQRKILLADELLRIGEIALENWLASKGQTPDGSIVEGFRLLALHRQGARGDPSFNACRESCRELVYHHNCARMLHGGEGTRALKLGAMVARHLVLFIDGKLENSGLGEFCCSSRPLRSREGAGAGTV
jgi:hypothetical protein